VAPPRLSFTWCHGAPGIALSSLRAALLDRECATTHLGRAQRALATTLVAIDEMLNHTRPDLSLCHGLSGLGEVTLIASQFLREPSYHERADSLARVLIDRYAASGDWPSGVPSGGPNPSLMLGLAGIGYWLLRLHDPAKVPPILLFVP
jgi:lantibiotic modifying enzyme